MPIRPLCRKVAGEIIDGLGFHSDVIITPDSVRKKIRLAMQVTHLGPECHEVVMGDIAILPEGGWVVTKLKEEDGSIKEYVIVEEKLLMGVID